MVGDDDEKAPAKLTVPVSIVGPCALEYTKLKTADHYWTDPSADELVQRHRIRGPPNRQDSPAKRPALGVSILYTSCAHLFRLYSWAPRGTQENLLSTLSLAYMSVTPASC